MPEKLIGVSLLIFSVSFLALRIVKYRVWEDRLSEESAMVDWFINLRYLAFGVAVAISSIALYIFDIAGSTSTKIYLTITSISIGIVNLIFSKLKGKIEPRLNLKIQMLTDLILITTLIYLSGGVESPLFILYFAHTFIASIIFGSKASYLISGISLSFFLFVIVLEFFRILPHHTLPITAYHGKLVYEPLYIVSILASLVVLLFVSGYFASRLVSNLRRKLDEEKNMIEDVARTSRLLELGEFAGIISHEVNNFLGVVVMKVKSVLESYEGQIPDKVMKDLYVIEKQSTEIAEVLRGILNFLRPTGSIMKFKIEDSVNNILKILQPRIKKAKIDVNINFSGTRQIKANKIQIEQVILNLLNNSIDAIERKKGREGEKVIKVTTYDKDKFLVLEVSDSGEGIPPNIRDRIFKPFFSTKSDGAGLGLYVAKKIIQNHGGEIEFESEENKGTTFRIFLPRSD